MWTLYIGHLNPVEETSGVQARLTNLGFYMGEINGTANPETRAALKLFQEMALKRENADGEIDSQPRSALLQQHGC